MQQQISDIVQHGVIDPNFKFSDADFELLSTLRYDPGFTHSDGRLSSRRLEEELDPRLSAADVHGELGESPLSDSGEYSIDAIAEMLGEMQKDTLPLSPPPEMDEEAEVSEPDLKKIFYNRFLLLGEQFKRLNLALRFFKWDFEIPLELLLEKLIQALPCPFELATDLSSRMQALLLVKKCYKMRVLVSSSGRMRVEAHELPGNSGSFATASQYFINTVLKGFLPQQGEVWDVFVDTQATVASPFTTFKTTRRNHYNAARERMTELATRVHNPASKSEILVYNSAFELMEGSISNVALLLNGTEPTKSFYQTPFLTSGCLCGVMRYYLLKKNLITEGNIDVRHLKVGDQVLLLNGVMGCVKGVIRNSLE
ncbi:LAQU0S05e06216g1_1 [Lachancea quebecensis]|uniref:LAQU0S05e06216g1_1 n=1 Tax=Lachancea quebecensis TaxID=1654605 RepID=A0A0P1KR76_9SACH|nr:LAQU0S05e06216g1_1 [Lachancea quebecensis]